MKKIAAIALILALLLSLAAFSTRASADPKATTAPTKEPTPTAEPTPEANEEPSPSPEGTNKNTATIVMGGGPSNEVTDTEEIRGGTNQNDAFLLPLDTKLYGTVRDGWSINLWAPGIFTPPFTTNTAPRSPADTRRKTAGPGRSKRRS